MLLLCALMTSIAAKWDNIRQKSLIFPRFQSETQNYQQCFIGLSASVLPHFRTFMLKKKKKGITVTYNEKF